MNNIKSLLTYIAATLAFLVTIKSLLGPKFPEKYLLLAGLIAISICMFFFMIERLRPQQFRSSVYNNASEHESFEILSRQAHQETKFAATNDEDIALQANKMVRKVLDKHCISYQDYRLWRKKNNQIFHALLAPDGQLIGFFDIFPLNQTSGKLLFSGQIKERDLTRDAILPLDRMNECKFVYISSIVANPNQAYYPHALAKQVIINKLVDFLVEQYPPDPSRTIFAYALTKAGERLLKNHHFTKIQPPQYTRQNMPLYALNCKDYATILTILTKPILDTPKVIRNKRQLRQLLSCSTV
jgi:hypothetical protein